MRGLGSRLAGMHRNGSVEPVVSAEEVDAPEGGGIRRRALLFGAATGAGVVAANAVPTCGSAPAVASPAVAAAPLVSSLFQTSGLTAADVTVDPAGEIVDDNVQLVLEALDQRLGRARLINDQAVAMTIVDDFMGSSVTGSRVGPVGWTVGNTGTNGAVAVPQIMICPGVVNIGTNAVAGGWQNIHLGSNILLGSPVLVGEWRFRLAALNALGSDECSVYVGLHDNVSGADPTKLEPTNGFYFQYSPADPDIGANYVPGNWWAVCANTQTVNGVTTTHRTKVDCGVAAETTSFHRFRITSDGGGNALFSIDGVQIPDVISLNLPSGLYAPTAAITKTTGAAGRSLSLDYFALRYEQAR